MGGPQGFWWGTGEPRTKDSNLNTKTIRKVVKELLFVECPQVSDPTYRLLRTSINKKVFNCAVFDDSWGFTGL